MEELSLDLIFNNNIKSFCKQNSKLRIYSKPDRNQSKLSVCIDGPQDTIKKLKEEMKKEEYIRDVWQGAGLALVK